MAAKPVRGAPSAKKNDGLWHCTNDEARGTVFVKGAARRSASTWPVPAAASAVGRPWSCTLPPELGLHMCGYLDAPSLARLEISRGLGDQAPRAWEAQAAGLDHRYLDAKSRVYVATTSWTTLRKERWRIEDVDGAWPLT